jgi:multiple sugar transport system substrate-binding protein
MPLVIPTSNSLNTLHTAASWVWDAGGNFIDQTGKYTIFNSAEARAGFRAYFDLHRYLAPAAQRLDTEQSDRLFLDGKAAVTISDPGLLNTLIKSPPAGAAVVRTALPPGVPFVGGSNLVVWRHGHNHKLAVELVRFLIDQQNQIAYSQQARSLPVRLDALTGRPFATDPLFQPAVEGLKLGRSYPTSRLWGLMEEKLIAELNEIWDKLLTDPALDLDLTLTEHMHPLGRRLNAILAADTRK